MKVKDIRSHIENFIKIQGIEANVQYSKPWHFNFHKGEKVPFGDCTGIYLYAEALSDNWNIPIESCQRDIWYIGKSEGDLGGRVGKHMGLIYEPNSREVCTPRFKYNDWHSDADVPADIKRQIADGELVVYTIKLVSEKTLLALALEKYLLSIHVRVTGRLPVLNKDL